MAIKVNDTVRGWFGEAVVTDVAYGWLEDAATHKRTSSVDNMIRIRQYRKDGEPKYTYIYRQDVKEVV